MIHELVIFRDTDILQIGCGDSRVICRYADFVVTVLGSDPAESDVQHILRSTPGPCRRLWLWRTPLTMAGRQVLCITGTGAILDGVFLAVAPAYWARWWRICIRIIRRRPWMARTVAILECAVGVGLVLYSRSSLRRSQLHPKESDSENNRALFRTGASRLLVLLFRAPVWLYRLRLGWFLGYRFLLLTHHGRKSGRIYRTVIEVIHYNPETRESVVVSGWGSRADWYRNIRHLPPLEVETGGDRYQPVFRELGPDDQYPIVLDYMQRLPRPARPIVRRLGFDIKGTEAERRAHAGRLLMIGFRPADRDQGAS